MKQIKKSSQIAKDSLFWRAIAVLPIMIPACLAAFSVVAVILLLANNLGTGVTFGLGSAAVVLVAGIVWKYIGANPTQKPGTKNEKRIFDLIIIIFVLLWAGGNALYTSQHVITDRDPATYAVAGAMLIERNDLHLQTPPAFEGIEGVQFESAGFSSTDKDQDVVYAQGQHLLPILLGLAGRLTNVQTMLHVNVIFGAVALLAVYGFARYFIRPRWAFLAVLILGVSLPLLYFSRDTYTEPLLMIFTFGSLVIIWEAMQKKKAILWLLAGIVAGAGTLARIDAYITIAALVLFLAIWLLLRQKRERITSLRHSGLFMLGIGTAAVVGWLDIAWLSQSYYENTFSLFLNEVKLVLAISGLGLLMVLCVWCFPKLLQWLNEHTKSWRAPVFVIVIIIAGLVLASRPLWMEGYAMEQNDLIARIQQREGEEVVSRNYAELSTQWAGWYIGSLLAAIGMIGIGLAGAYVLRNKRYLPLAAGVLVVAGTSLLYLIKPSITPDQIWASRRLLPVVLPGLAIFAVFAIDQFCQRYVDKKLQFIPIFMGLAYTAFLLAPLMASWPFLQHRDTTRLETVERICRSLPENAAVIWVADARLELVQPTQTFCDVPAINLSTADIHADIATKEKIAPIAKQLRQRGYRPVIGTYEKDIHFLPTRTQDDFGKITHNYEVIEPTLTKPPHKIIPQTSTVVLGIVKNNGSVTPITEVR